MKLLIARKNIKKQKCMVLDSGSWNPEELTRAREDDLPEAGLEENV